MKMLEERWRKEEGGGGGMEKGRGSVFIRDDVPADQQGPGLPNHVTSWRFQ